MGNLSAIDYQGLRLARACVEFACRRRIKVRRDRLSLRFKVTLRCGSRPEVCAARRGKKPLEERIPSQVVQKENPSGLHSHFPDDPLVELDERCDARSQVEIMKIGAPEKYLCVL